MKDLELDFDNNKVINNFVDNEQRVAQQIRVGVRSWTGDFFLNDLFGVDYDSCWGDMQLMKAYVSEQILAIDGVERIESITIERTKGSNNETQFTINATIMLNRGQISILETIGDIL